MSTEVRIIGIRVEQGGETPHHVERYFWVHRDVERGDHSTEGMVTFVEKKGGKAYLEDGSGRRAELGVITCPQGHKFLDVVSGTSLTTLMHLPRE